MRLRAKIRNITRKATHLQGLPLSGEIKVSTIPDPAAVEIVEQEGAFYLLRLDSQGHCIADTWHESVKAAQAQAHFEFDIEDDDWTETEN